MENSGTTAENNQADERLIGSWKVESGEFHGRKITFHRDGVMKYEISERGVNTMLFLKFRTGNSCIFSSQPPKTDENTTKYKINGDVLHIEFENRIIKYKRIS